MNPDSTTATNETVNSVSPSEPPEKPIPGLKRLRYQLEFFGLRLACALIPLLPYHWLKPIANFAGFCFHHLDSRGRAVAIDNLRAAFGDTYDIAARNRIARASFQNFARTMLCLFWSPNLNSENYQKYIRIEGLDTDPIHGSKNSPGIYILSHFSNFEWLSLGSSFALGPGLAVAQTFKNPLLGPIFDQLRAQGGHSIIPPSRALVRLIKRARSGGIVGAAADLSINPSLGAVPVRCFGLWTAMSPMAGILYERGNSRLVPSQIFPEPDGFFRIVYRAPLAMPEGSTHQQIAQACWDTMEPVIRKNPELWLWSYKQWRYKPSTAPDGTYPFYSNIASRFDNILPQAEKIV